MDLFLDIVLLGEGMILLLWQFILYETKEDIVGSEVRVHTLIFLSVYACACVALVVMKVIFDDFLHN